MKVVIASLITVLGLSYGQTPGVINERVNVNPSAGIAERNVRPSVPTGEIQFHPTVTLQLGPAPVLPALDVTEIKGSLHSEGALKVNNLRYGEATWSTPATPSYGEILASYKAMVQQHLAAEELRALVTRGATDKEIETFKTNNEEKILNLRYEVMKIWGTTEEIRATEDALHKFQARKAEEER